MQIHQVVLNLLIHIATCINEEFSSPEIMIETIVHPEQIEIVFGCAGKSNAALQNNGATNSNQVTRSEVDITLCHVIIETNGGSLQQTSKTSQNSSFHIFLPRAVDTN
jgi:hypothetical protein